jgi:hypothetical protein
MLRADDNSVRVIHNGKEIARHRRCYEKRQIIVDPEHRKAALALRKRSTDRQIEAEFDALGAGAKEFRLGLLNTPLKTIIHLRRILALVRLYGKAEVMAAIALALQYKTFDSAYVKNLIDQERRRKQAPSPISLSPKRQELVEEIHLEEPDPGDYDSLLH